MPARIPDAFPAHGDQSTRSAIHMRFVLLASFGALSLCACQGNSDIAAKAGASSDALSIDSLRCVAQGPANTCVIFGVSVYELIANPVEYHGKRVRVFGFAHFEFEGNGLYAHREDYEHQLNRNGLWLEQPLGTPDSVQDKYVLVEGTFNARMRGHFGMWSGSLLDVTRLDVMGRLQVPPLESIPNIDLSKPRQ